MLAMPAPTPYDLRFRLLGIPVRVHPLFWIITAVLGFSQDDPTSTLLWVACVFVSILVHEFGHGLTARSFGHRASIALYAMGGLCASEPDRESPRQRLAILLWGPGAGFVLLAVALAIAWAALGLSPGEDLSLLLHLFGVDDGRRITFDGGERAWLIVVFLFQINLFWGLLNLMPIWPLDGGQVAMLGFTQFDRRSGRRRGHILSMVTAAGLAVWALARHDTFLALFLATFAFINYQQVQALQHVGYDVDPDDWWKRSR